MLDDREQDDREKLGELMGEFSFAMLTTRRGRELRSRPMAILDSDTGAHLLFFSRGGSGKLDELRDDPHANISMQDESRFVSVSGSLRVFRDPDLAAELWSESQREWFPRGPEDPDLMLIEIDPSYAEYWDRSRMRVLRLVFSPSQASVRRLDGDTEHAKIELNTHH